MHEITLNEVRQLIASLRTVYAAQFNKQFPATGENAIPMSMVEQIALKTLVGVNQNQFNNALGRLLTAGGVSCLRLLNSAPGVSVKAGCLRKRLGHVLVSSQQTVQL